MSVKTKEASQRK